MARPVSELPTDWEFTLLDILWDKGQCSVDDVRETLREEGIKRSDSSIRTILRNMSGKGYVLVTSKGRTSYYKPAVLRNQMEKTVFRHMAQTLYNGKQDRLLMRLIEETRITPTLSRKIKTLLG